MRKFNPERERRRMLHQTQRDIEELSKMLHERGAHEHGRLQALRGEFLMRKNMLKAGGKRRFASNRLS